MLKGVSPSDTKHRSPNTTGNTKAQKPLYTMDSKAQFFHGTLRFELSELSSVALENEAWLNTARYKKISLVYLDAHVALLVPLWLETTFLPPKISGWKL